MSKLLDKLRAAAKGQQPQLGFGHSNKKKKAPGIGLIAAVASDTELAKSAASVADALLVGPGFSADADSAPAGIWGIDASESAGSGAAAESGADFVVISAESEISALRAEEVSKLIRLDVTAPDSVLQAVGTLPVEAVLVGAPAKGTLKVADLLDYLRVGTMVRRPLILPVAASFGIDQLVAIRDAGIAAVCMTVTSAADIERLQAMRKTIDEFPEPPKRDRNRDGVTPTLPAMQASQHHSHDHDDDDEDDD